MDDVAALLITKAVLGSPWGAGQKKGLLICAIFLPGAKPSQATTRNRPPACWAQSAQRSRPRASAWHSAAYAAMRLAEAPTARGPSCRTSLYCQPFARKISGFVLLWGLTCSSLLRSQIFYVCRCGRGGSLCVGSTARCSPEFCCSTGHYCDSRVHGVSWRLRFAGSR